MQADYRQPDYAAPLEKRAGFDRPFTVTEINGAVRQRLENEFRAVWITGELSDVTIHHSGHVYFTLKDSSSTLRGVAFRFAEQARRLQLARGMAVELRGTLTVYEARGDYQINAVQLYPVGAGELNRQLEELKARLAAEGLLDPTRKRPIPVLPRTIGLITAATGAALKDFLTNIRCPIGGLHVRFIPSLVQGAEAPRKIIAALNYLNHEGHCDVIVITRGGGGTEDLSAFNDEALARAIASSDTPVLCAIGHDRDVSLCDLVADARESTPTGAAARVVRGKLELCRRVLESRTRMAQSLQAQLGWLRQRYDRASSCHFLNHPRDWLDRLSQRLDYAGSRLESSLPALAQRHRARLNAASARLELLSRQLLPAAASRLNTAAGRLAHCAVLIPAAARQRLTPCAAMLKALDPAQVLTRGYSILYDQNGRIVRSAGDVQPGDTLRARLKQGELTATVQSTTPEEERP